jgi:hypothetical protein
MHLVNQLALPNRPSKLSAENVLEHLLVEAQIGNDLPQLAILVLELLQPPHLGRQQAIVLGLCS